MEAQRASQQHQHQHQHQHASSSSEGRYAIHHVSYGAHSRQVIALYYPADPTTQKHQQETLPLLVFVHGGAWRTGSIDEHHALASSLAAAGTCCVALVEYRLSLPSTAPGQENVIENQHPAHIQDLHLALQHLLLDPSPLSAKYDAQQTILVGHSIGAWLLCSLLLDASSALTVPRPVEFPLDRDQLCAIRTATKAWVLVDGIYDLEDLLAEYPDYLAFVAQAFSPAEVPLLDSSGGDGSFRAVSVPSWPAPTDSQSAQQGSVIVAHSPDDRLLSLRQSRGAAKYLKRVLGDRWVVEDYESLTGNHDELLQTSSFRQWLESIVSRSRMPSGTR